MSNLNLNAFGGQSSFPEVENKRKRSKRGDPDPNAEVVALSPRTLTTTHRFVCEICSKGFRRDQNLQLHRRGHNLPGKLKKKVVNEVARKKVYVCPVSSCVHHNPARALGDITGIKKHFSRKHCEKNWKCNKCSKMYAVKTDWKAHSRICGKREFKCCCGSIFSRKSPYKAHIAFCSDEVVNALMPSINSNIQLVPSLAAGDTSSARASHQIPIEKHESHEQCFTLGPQVAPINTGPGSVVLPTDNFTSASPPLLQYLAQQHAHDQNLNLHLNPLMGPTTALLSHYPAPADSANAFLQKAARFGGQIASPVAHELIRSLQGGQVFPAGYGLDFSSGAPATGSNTGGIGSSSGSMINAIAGLGGISCNPSKKEFTNPGATLEQFGNSIGNEGGCDNANLTRDFLGLQQSMPE